MASECSETSLLVVLGRPKHGKGRNSQKRRTKLNVSVVTICHDAQNSSIRPHGWLTRERGSRKPSNELCDAFAHTECVMSSYRLRGMFRATTSTTTVSAASRHPWSSGLIEFVEGVLGKSAGVVFVWHE